MDATGRLVLAASPEAAARLGVTVVITTYNHAHFLGEALASARSQSHAPEEVIVVDDGSTDDPAAVVARFPGVRLIRQDNKGLAAARNTGWRATKSRFVVFLDADDRLMPDALVANLRRFEEQPESAFVYGGYRWIDVGGRVLRTVPPRRSERTRMRRSCAATRSGCTRPSCTVATASKRSVNLTNACGHARTTTYTCGSLDGTGSPAAPGAWRSTVGMTATCPGTCR